MLRQLICFICFLVPFALSGATQHESRSCGLSTSTVPKTDETSDNDLNSYNELLGELLPVFLESKGILVHLVFDCNLARNPGKANAEKSFGVVAQDRITDDGKLQLTSLTDHFSNITQQVQKEVEKLQPKQKKSCFNCLNCFKSCQGTKPMTFRFGCGYSVRNFIITTKCAFEKFKLKN